MPISTRVTALSLFLLLSPTLGQADPLPGGSYAVYELSGTSIEISNSPLGLVDGVFPLWGKGSNPNPGQGEPGVSPGLLTLQFGGCTTAPDCTGAPADIRLSRLDLNQHFTVSDTFVDIATTLSTDVHGSYDGAATIAWNEPGTWRSDGGVDCQFSPTFCPVGGFEFGPNPVHITEAILFGDFTFNLDTANPYDLFADFLLPPGAFAEVGNLTLHLRATQLIPEPSAVLLVGLGICALGMRRRRDRLGD